MKIPQLQKKPEVKSCHDISWEDNYSWIHQKNILEVLKDSSKLIPEVRKYLEEENQYFEYQMKDTKNFQKTYFLLLNISSLLAGALNYLLKLLRYFFGVSSYNYLPMFYCDKILFQVFFEVVVFSFLKQINI